MLSHMLRNEAAVKAKKVLALTVVTKMLTFTKTAHVGVLTPRSEC